MEDKLPTTKVTFKFKNASFVNLNVTFRKLKVSSDYLKLK